MGKYKLPERWLDYSPLGKCIEGTKIVTFKVPLNEGICKNNKLKEEEWFTPEQLVQRQPNLKTVIDLTNTHRYYNAREEFGAKGIDHIKILVEGKGILPPNWQIKRFFDAVDTHMEKYNDETDALIGVHCTHGLNRTGYFVCRYLVDRLKFDPDDAINRFNQARGHNIERENLLTDIKLKDRPSNKIKMPPSGSTTYQSPLGDDSYEEGNNSRYDRRRQDRHRGRHDKPSRSDLDTNWRARDDRKDDSRKGWKSDDVEVRKEWNRNRFKKERT